MNREAVELYQDLVTSGSDIEFDDEEAVPLMHEASIDDPEH